MPTISFPRSNASQQSQKTATKTKVTSNEISLFGANTKESKNKLLTDRLTAGLNNKSDIEIINFCKQELQLISLIVDAHGNKQEAMKLFENKGPHQSGHKQYLNQLLDLFENRNTGIASKNLNRTAAKYVATIRSVLTVLNKNISEILEDTKIQENLRQIETESKKSYIQNVHVNRVGNNLVIQLGQANGTMGEDYKLKLTIGANNDNVQAQKELAEHEEESSVQSEISEQTHPNSTAQSAAPGRQLSHSLLHANRNEESTLFATKTEPKRSQSMLAITKNQKQAVNYSKIKEKSTADIEWQEISSIELTNNNELNEYKENRDLIDLIKKHNLPVHFKPTEELASVHAERIRLDVPEIKDKQLLTLDIEALTNCMDNHIIPDAKTKEAQIVLTLYSDDIQENKGKINEIFHFCKKHDLKIYCNGTTLSDDTIVNTDVELAKMLILSDKCQFHRINTMQKLCEQHVNLTNPVLYYNDKDGWITELQRTGEANIKQPIEYLEQKYGLEKRLNITLMHHKAPSIYDTKQFKQNFGPIWTIGDGADEKLADQSLLPNGAIIYSTKDELSACENCIHSYVSVFKRYNKDKESAPQISIIIKDTPIELADDFVLFGKYILDSEETYIQDQSGDYRYSFNGCTIKLTPNNVNFFSAYNERITELVKSGQVKVEFDANLRSENFKNLKIPPCTIIENATFADPKTVENFIQQGAILRKCTLEIVQNKQKKHSNKLKQLKNKCKDLTINIVQQKTPDYFEDRLLINTSYKQEELKLIKQWRAEESHTEDTTTPDYERQFYRRAIERLNQITLEKFKQLPQAEFIKLDMLKTLEQTGGATIVYNSQSITSLYIDETPDMKKENDVTSKIPLIREFITKNESVVIKILFPENNNSPTNLNIVRLSDNAIYNLINKSPVILPMRVDDNHFIYIIFYFDEQNQLQRRVFDNMNAPRNCYYLDKYNESPSETHIRFNIPKEEKLDFGGSIHVNNIYKSDSGAARYYCHSAFGGLVGAMEQLATTPAEFITTYNNTNKLESALETVANKADLQATFFKNTNALIDYCKVTKHVLPNRKNIYSKIDYESETIDLTILSNRNELIDSFQPEKMTIFGLYSAIKKQQYKMNTTVSENSTA